MVILFSRTREILRCASPETYLSLLFVNAQATNPSGAELQTLKPLQVTEDESEQPKV